MERDCDVSYVYFATLNDLSPDVVYFCIELQCCHWNHEEFNFHWTGTQLEKAKEISLQKAFEWSWWQCVDNMVLSEFLFLYFMIFIVGHLGCLHGTERHHIHWLNQQNKMIEEYIREAHVFRLPTITELHRGTIKFRSKRRMWMSCRNLRPSKCSFTVIKMQQTKVFIAIDVNVWRLCIIDLG